MKKWVSGIVFIAVISCISFSCNQSKSLQELLREEIKAIDRYISANDLVILKDYPQDGIFKENEYFKTDDGLFFHVVDSGNGKRVQNLNDVTVRFEYYIYVKTYVQGDSTTHSPVNLYEPFSFVYGIAPTYTAPYFQSQAWVIPLAYIGERAIVDMIVPSSLGSSNDRSSVLPIFYKNLQYTGFN